MADIFIKNMKMPKDCLHCGFSHMASDCLKIWIICKPKDITVADDDAVKDGRPDWCPLVEVPSADVVEVRHGKWVEIKGVLHPLETDGICTECGYETGFYNFFNFCPNCGADMRGGT